MNKATIAVFGLVSFFCAKYARSKPSDVIIPIVRRATFNCKQSCAGHQKTKDCFNKCLVDRVDRQMAVFDFIQVIGEKICTKKQNMEACMLLDRCVTTTKDRYGFNWESAVKCFGKAMFELSKKKYLKKTPYKNEKVI